MGIILTLQGLGRGTLSCAEFENLFFRRCTPNGTFPCTTSGWIWHVLWKNGLLTVVWDSRSSNQFVQVATERETDEHEHKRDELGEDLDLPSGEQWDEDGEEGCRRQWQHDQIGEGRWRAAQLHANVQSLVAVLFCYLQLHKFSSNLIGYRPNRLLCKRWRSQRWAQTEAVSTRVGAFCRYSQTVDQHTVDIALQWTNSCETNLSAYKISPYSGPPASGYGQNFHLPNYMHRYPHTMDPLCSGQILRPTSLSIVDRKKPGYT